jgi:acyl-CoA synthetase (NDP forming)
MRWIQSAENFGVSRVIGLGNKCDIDDADALEYLGHDPETKAIAMYLEGFKDGRRFIEVASKVSRVKPIIALKGGRTSAGARAALSHTASLAGDDRIIDAAFRQAGIVRVQNYSDLIDCAKALAFQPLPRGDGVAILAPSGAMGVIASDACESMGLRVATLSRKTTERIASISPSWIRIGNPVDIWAAVSIHGVEFAYCEGLKAVLADEAVDSAIVILLLVRESAPKSLDFIADICRNNPTKPVLVTITGEKELFEKAKADLERRSVPVYYPLEGAFRALAIMTLCAKRIAR